MDTNNTRTYSGVAFVFRTLRNRCMAEKLMQLLTDAGMQAVCLDTELMQERTMKLYMERHGEGPHVLLFPYDKDNVKPFDIVSAAAMAAITLHPLIPAELTGDMAGEQGLKRLVPIAARYLAADR